MGPKDKDRKLNRFFAHVAYPLAQNMHLIETIANRVSIPLKTSLYDTVIGLINSITGWRASESNLLSEIVSVYGMKDRDEKYVIEPEHFAFHSKQTLGEVKKKLKSAAGRGRRVKALYVAKQEYLKDDKITTSDFKQFIKKIINDKITTSDFKQFIKKIKKSEKL